MCSMFHFLMNPGRQNSEMRKSLKIMKVKSERPEAGVRSHKKALDRWLPVKIYLILEFLSKNNTEFLNVDAFFMGA